VHVVDGYWVVGERSCDLASSDECALAARTATSWLPEGESGVVAAEIAGAPKTWVRADGYKILSEFGGFSVPFFVILDLTGGQRRVFEVYCQGSPPGAPPTSCSRLSGDSYRVGEAAPLGPGPVTADVTR
jgi:hypothetical protein